MRKFKGSLRSFRAMACVLLLPTLASTSFASPGVAKSKIQQICAINQFYNFGRLRGAEDAKSQARYSSADIRLRMYNLTTKSRTGSIALLRKFVVSSAVVQKDDLLEFSEGYNSSYPKAITSGPELECSKRLRALGIDVLMYLEDHNDELPDTRSAKSLDTSLQKYSLSREEFIDNITNTPYLPNPMLSHRYYPDETHWKDIVLAFEPLDRSSEPKQVLFLDGHVGQLSNMKIGSLLNR